MTDKFRVLGNVIMIIGYFVVLNVSSPIGSAIKLLGFSCVIPFTIKNKYWDFLAVMAFYFTLDATNIVKHLITN